MKDMQDRINKYLDGDMNEIEKTEFLNAVENSVELKYEMDLLTKSHKILASVATDKVSSDFTSQLMKKVLTKTNSSKEQKTFLYTVYSIFGIIILGICVYLSYQIFASYYSEPHAIFSIKEFSNQFGNYFSKLFGRQGLSIIGSVLALLLLISSYLLYDQKRIRRT